MSISKIIIKIVSKIFGTRRFISHLRRIIRFGGNKMKKEQLASGLSWILIIVGGLGTLTFIVEHESKSLLLYSVGLVIGIISKILLVKNKS